MAGMVEQLVEILSEQTERYEELLGLAAEKRDIIIKNDVESLQKLNHLENIVVSQNQKLEKKRQELVADMAIVLNEKEDDLTLTRLIELMDGKEEVHALTEARDRIKVVIEELSEINAQNGQLVQNALEYIDYTTNLLRSSQGGQPTNYYPGADDVDLGESSYFDTKN